MFNFKSAPSYVYRLEIDGTTVGYTNRFEHKIMLENHNRVDYFGVYATPALADEGDTCKHSAQYWLDATHSYKLCKIPVMGEER